MSIEPVQLLDEKQWFSRINNEQKNRLNDHRDPFQRDRARILHSAAFRRLQAKTQVHGTGSNDFHRTRLTHSLEAAQIGTGILAQVESKFPHLSSILPSFNLIESICLAHDIGNPPFGHGGEVALNYAMRDQGGFEGNAQTLRIVSQLEPYTQHFGMNLSRRTLLGLLKYPVTLDKLQAHIQPNALLNSRQLKSKEWLPPKGIYQCDNDILQWISKPFTAQDREHFSSLRSLNANKTEHNKSKYKSLDCSIMEIADDIAYGVHDLEDAIVLGLVSKEQWQQIAVPKLKSSGEAWFENNCDRLTEKLFSGEHYLRKDAIGGIVNAFLTNATIVEIDGFSHSLLRYNANLTQPMTVALNVFKHFVRDFVIQAHSVQIAEYRGQQIVLDLFETLSSDPERLLPDATRLKWTKSADDSTGLRIICDYIAAMTDGYANKLHQQLFGR
jgi:dGTPase